MKNTKSSTIIGAVIAGLLMLVSIVVLMFCTTKVPAGYAAVQYSISGGIKDEILTQGWHITAPTIKTTKYTIAMEQSYLTADNTGDSRDDEHFSASSSEGKAIDVDLAFNYQYDIERLPEIFNRFRGQSGRDVLETFIKPNMKSWAKEVFPRFTVSDVIGVKRSDLNAAIQDHVSKKFAEYGILISNASAVDIRVDEETMRVISEKINSLQEAETAKIKNQQKIDAAEAEKKVKETQAEADANVMRITAEAEADSITITAEAEAEAKKKLAEAITPELIEYMHEQAWNGSYVTTSVGSDASLIVNPE